MHAFNKCDEHSRNICSNKYRGIKNKCIKSIKIQKVFEHMSFFAPIPYILHCFENKRTRLIGKLIKWNVLNVARNFYKTLSTHTLALVACDGSIRPRVADYRIPEVVIWGVFLRVNAPSQTDFAPLQEGAKFSAAFRLTRHHDTLVFVDTVFYTVSLFGQNVDGSSNNDAPTPGTLHRKISDNFNCLCTRIKHLDNGHAVAIFLLPAKKINHISVYR